MGVVDVVKAPWGRSGCGACGGECNWRGDPYDGEIG